MEKYSSRSGLAALEAVIIFAIFLSMYFIIFKGIDPVKQVAEVNNIKRRMDIRALNDALMYYAVDHGAYPDGISTSPEDIAKKGVDLCNIIVPQYISGLPTDPKKGYQQIKNCDLEYDTRYTITKQAFDNRITISAPNADLGEDIELTQ